MDQEKEKMIIDNQHLVDFVIFNKMHFYKNHSDYEDLHSVGILALVKAVKDYQSEKGTLSTFACKYISNDIFNFIRQMEKSKKHVSFETPVGVGKDGESLTLLDILKDCENNYNNIEVREELVQVMNIILNCLKQKSRLVILYRLSGLSYADIAEKMAISQSYITKIVIDAKKAVKDKLKSKIPQNIEIEFSIEGDEFVLSFPLDTNLETMRFDADEKNFLKLADVLIEFCS